MTAAQDTATRIGRDDYLRELWDLSAPAYRRFVQRYATHRRITGTLAHSIDPGSRTVLDFGCGPGNSTITIKTLLPEASVTGLDYSDAMISEHVNLRAATWPPTGDTEPGSGVALEHGTIDEHAHLRPGRYDTIVCSNSLFHVVDQSGAVRAFRHALRDGGAIAFSVYGSLFRPQAEIPWPYGDTCPHTDEVMTAILTELARRGHHVTRGEDRESISEAGLRDLFASVELRVRCTGVLRLRRTAEERLAFFRIPAVAAEVFPDVPATVVADAIDAVRIPTGAPPLERPLYTFLAE